MPSQFVSIPSVPSQISIQTLVAILRRANVHYSQLAAIMRASRRSTGHARKQAAALQLTIDIENARNLDHRQVSVIPLPVLDIATSPIAPQAGRERELKRNTTRLALRCSIPQDVVNKEESSALSSVSDYSTVSLSTPEVIAAPVVLRGWRPVTSRWSTSTADEEEIDVEEEELEDGVVYSSDYEEGMDLSNSEEEHVGLFEDTPMADTSLAPRLDIPVDVSRFSWGSALTSDYYASSSSSSLGPVTPAEGMSKLMIGIKRKAVDSDFDMVDEAPEKRPKYERKPWATPKRTAPGPRKF